MPLSYPTNPTTGQRATVLGVHKMGGIFTLEMADSSTSDDIIRVKDTHGLRAGDQVRINKYISGSGSAIPDLRKFYYVQGNAALTDTSFQINTTPGTTGMEFGTSFTGTNGKGTGTIVPLSTPQATESRLWDAVTLAPYDSHERVIRSKLGNVSDAEAGIISVTGLASTDVISATSHGLSNGDRVVFVSLTGGYNLRRGLTYYVVNKNANDFQISETLGDDLHPVALGADISAASLRKLTVGGVRQLTGANTLYPRILKFWLYVSSNPLGDYSKASWAPSLGILNGIKDRGAVPMLDWSWQDIGNLTMPRNGAIPYRDIYGGLWNDQIDAVMNRIQSYGDTVIVRMFWEQNGDWFPWFYGSRWGDGAYETGNYYPTTDEHSPPIYKLGRIDHVRAWKHIVERSRPLTGGSNGTRNANGSWSVRPTPGKARFFWCPHNIDSLPMDWLYPGNEYVDYIGWDEYARHDTSGSGTGAVWYTDTTNNAVRITGIGGKLLPGDRVQVISLGSAPSCGLSVGAIYYVTRYGSPQLGSWQLRTKSIKGPIVDITASANTVEMRGAPNMVKHFGRAMDRIRKLTAGSERTQSPVPVILGETGYMGEYVAKTVVSPAPEAAYPDAVSPIISGAAYASRATTPPTLPEAILTAADDNREDDLADFRKQWLGKGLVQMRAAYPDLVAVVYFDCDMMPDEGKPYYWPVNWRFDARPAVTKRWATLTRQANMRGTIT